MSSFRQTFSRNRAGSATTPLQALFQDVPPTSSPNPGDITTFFDDLQTFLTLACINPVLITQMWSQVIYWVSCMGLRFCDWTTCD